MKHLLKEAAWHIAGWVGFILFCVFVYVVLTVQFSIHDLFGL